MKMHDVLLSVGGNLEWITEIYREDLSDAITDAIRLVGRAEYVGHKSYQVENGRWVEVK